MESFSKALVSDYPVTLKLARELGPIVVALIAAVIAFIIQWRQWRTAERQRQIASEKLKFDLYEKRFAIYLATRDFLMSLSSKAKLDPDEYKEFISKTWHARFLFDDDFVAYIEKFRKMGISLDLFSKTYDQNLSNPKRGDMIDEHYKSLSYIMTELEELDRRFLPYLDFSRLR